MSMPPTPRSCATPPKPAPAMSPAAVQAFLEKASRVIDGLAAEVAALKAGAAESARAEAATAHPHLLKLREQLGPNSPHYRRALYNEAKARVDNGKAQDIGTATNDLEREMSS